MSTPASALSSDYIRRKYNALHGLRSVLGDLLTYAGGDLPADASQLIQTPDGTNGSSNGFPVYPAPGAARIVIIAYTVPPGMNCIFDYLAIVHNGGQEMQFNGSGNIIWRVLINGGAVKGMHALNSEVGSWAQPNPVLIPLAENDVIQITVEVPAGQAAIPVGMTSGARLHGHLFPVAKGVTTQ